MRYGVLHLHSNLNSISGNQHSMACGWQGILSAVYRVQKAVILQLARTTLHLPFSCFSFFWNTQHQEGRARSKGLKAIQKPACPPRPPQDGLYFYPASLINKGFPSHFEIRFEPRKRRFQWAFTQELKQVTLVVSSQRGGPSTLTLQRKNVCEYSGPILKKLCWQHSPRGKSIPTCIHKSTFTEVILFTTGNVQK